jgi:hypothetical protein
MYATTTQLNMSSLLPMLRGAVKGHAQSPGKVLHANMSCANIFFFITPA